MEADVRERVRSARSGRSQVEDLVGRFDALMSHGSVLRNYWHRFIWAWMSPVAVLFVLLLPAWSEHPVAVFVAVVVPLLFVCNSIAWKPVRTGEIPRLTGFIYVALVPLLIWTTILMTIFGLAALAPTQ